MGVLAVRCFKNEGCERVDLGVLLSLASGDRLRGRVVVWNVTQPFGLEGEATAAAAAVDAAGLAFVVVALSLSALGSLRSFGVC